MPANTYPQSNLLRYLRYPLSLSPPGGLRADDGGRDIFVHSSGISGVGHKSLEKGERVEYGRALGGGRVLRRPRDLLGCWGLFTISTGFFIVVRKIPIFGSNQSSAARSVLLTAGVPSLQSFRPFVPLFLRGPAGDLADDRGRDMAINLTRRRRLDKPPSPIKSQV